MTPADRGRTPVGLTTLPAELDHLSPAMARIAAALLADPDGAARGPARELARRARVSTPTVSRFARLLGHASYGALQRAVVRERGVAAALPDTITAGVGPHDDAPSVVAAVLGDLAAVVRETRLVLDPAAVAHAARRVADARRVLAVGAGASGLVALDLQHKLERIGLAVAAADDLHRGLTLATTLAAGDVVVAASHSGSTRETVAVARAARDHGAHVVALTSRPRSALGRTAHDVLLTVTGAETDVRPAATGSRISQLAAVDCLFVVVAQLTHPRSRTLVAGSRSALRHTHEEDPA